MQENVQYEVEKGNGGRLDQVERPLSKRNTWVDRSLGELLGELSRGALTLVRNEVDFAKEEIAQKTSKAGKDITTIAFGGAVALAGFLCLLAAAIFGLALVLPLWLSALIVGIVISSIGAGILWIGFKRLENRSLAPRRTVGILKEEKEWLKDQLT